MLLYGMVVLFGLRDCLIWLLLCCLIVFIADGFGFIVSLVLLLLFIVWICLGVFALLLGLVMIVHAWWFG